MKQSHDETELLFCTKCGQDYEAVNGDLGTYMCPCGRINKNIDEALKRLGEEKSEKANDTVTNQSPNK